MSPRQQYRELNERVFGLYADGRPADALRLIDEAPATLSPWRAELASLSACLYGSLGRHRQALRVLEEAVADGAWWDPSVLAGDDDLAGARKLSSFGPIMESSRVRWEHHNAATDRSGDRLLIPSGPARGVLVALHGAEEDASDAATAWGSAVDSGIAVLAVRSSQRTSPNYRTWPDALRAAAEVDAAYGEIPAGLRSLPLYAAGFSPGGRVAMHWALTGTPLPVQGVVAVAPAVTVDALPPSAADDLAPARILVGADDGLLDDVRAVAQAQRWSRGTKSSPRCPV